MDKIVDDPVAMALVNSSGWCTTKAITMSNKMQLIQGLIFHETVLKREKQLAAFRKALHTLGLLKLILMNPELKTLFVHNGGSKLSALVFISLLECKDEVKMSKQYLQMRPGQGITIFSVGMYLQLKPY